MELESLRAKLEQILERKVTIEDGVEVDRVQADSVEFPSGKVQLVVHGSLTPAEHELISLLLDNGRNSDKKLKAQGSEEERQSLLLSHWMLERMESGDTDADLPEPFSMWSALSGVKVPLLLYGDYSERHQETSYMELKKLLKSFFEGDIVLIPLHNKQWLILGDEALLSSEDVEETIEESLSALASGLQAMAASEWVGECHVAATYPFSPGTSLIQTAMTLRETIELGRGFRLASNVHLPWELRLETLLDTVPKRAKLRFLEGVLRRTEPTFETETLQTLEAFFMENCNVSDTAKRLYIHRNTLLYRLDKFKQETGMDVRDFDHAVLVRLALLLYKVTKRI